METNDSADDHLVNRINGASNKFEFIQIEFNFLKEKVLDLLSIFKKVDSTTSNGNGNHE